MSLKSSRKHTASRRKNPQANRPQPTSPIAVISITPAGVNVSIEFDQSVSLNGVPQYTTNIAGANPVSAAMTAPTILQLTFDADVSLATLVNVPYEEPGVRNSSGGFVTPTSVAA